MRRGVTAACHCRRVSGTWQRAVEATGFRERSAEKQSAATKAVPLLLLSAETPPPVAQPAQTAAFFLTSFDPFVFSYCAFDFPTILHCAAELDERELLDRPEALLMSPRSLCLQPNARFRFSACRQQRLALVLQRLLHEHDNSERSPVRCAHALGVGCPLLVPFLRGVCLCVETQHPFAPQAAYVFEELLANGFVSPSLHLGGAYSDRRSALALLVQLAATEFGSESALLTGLLLAKEQAPPPAAAAVGRLVTLTLAAADRRRLDWALKSRGVFQRKLKPKHGWTLGRPLFSSQQEKRM
ncbi:hypothetical protein GH5_04212 [Leishmania sp. Ghana 2012 LV757]|uniref:hypothetical protein n=1 Tax=Leishmania sp. Ghana 2012 LV757 TaxID=2803181 RepID=UPI001B4D6B8C|nr:hypothetical protein GH5_04212 [Leishmania sp. Ghana 2012 LV757]